MGAAHAAARLVEHAVVAERNTTSGWIAREGGVLGGQTGVADEIEEQGAQVGEDRLAHSGLEVAQPRGGRRLAGVESEQSAPLGTVRAGQERGQGPPTEVEVAT